MLLVIRMSYNSNYHAEASGADLGGLKGPWPSLLLNKMFDRKREMFNTVIK